MCVAPAPVHAHSQGTSSPKDCVAAFGADMTRRPHHATGGSMARAAVQQSGRRCARGERCAPRRYAAHPASGNRHNHRAATTLVTRYSSRGNIRGVHPCETTASHLFAFATDCNSSQRPQMPWARPGWDCSKSCRPDARPVGPVTWTFGQVTRSLVLGRLLVRKRVWWTQTAFSLRAQAIWSPCSSTRPERSSHRTRRQMWS